MLNKLYSDELYKTVSYIIPAYNMGKYIRKCITSVFLQEYEEQKIEIIVVNDASTDNTMEVIQDTFDDRFDNKSSINRHESIGNYQIIDMKTNRGPGYALNKGFKEASGEYLCFLSADDYLMNRDKTRIQCSYMESAKSDLSYYKHYIRGSSSEKLPPKMDWKIMESSFLPMIPNNYLLDRNYLLFVALNIKNFINSSSFMFNRNSYFKYGEWDPTLRADCDGDMLLKYSLHGAKISEISDLKNPIFYRIHPGQVSNQSTLMHDSIKENRLKYKKEVINGKYPSWMKRAVGLLMR